MPDQDAEAGARAAEASYKVKHLEPRERRLAAAAAALNLVAALALELPNIHHKTPKGALSYEVALVVTLVLAALQAVAARVGRRSLVVFVSLIAGLAWIGAVPLLGGLFVGLGGWLIVRATRFNREAGAVRGGRGAGTDGRGGRKWGGGGASGRAGAASTRGERGTGREAATAVPQKSRRYTPPKPARRPRERRSSR